MIKQSNCRCCKISQLNPCDISPFQKMVQGVPKNGTRCPEQDMGRVVPVSNGFGTTTETFTNTISIPPAIAESRPRAVCLPALTKSYRNLPFLPVHVASWNPGKKTTVILSSHRMTN